MKTTKKIILMLLIVLTSGVAFISCEDGMDGADGINGVDGQDGLNGQDGADGEDGEDLTVSETIFEDKSSLASLVAIQPQFSFVKAYSLISSTDTLSNDFVLLGAQDGAGFLKDPDSNGYLYIVNSEDDYAV